MNKHNLLAIYILFAFFGAVNLALAVTEQNQAVVLSLSDGFSQEFGRIPDEINISSIQQSFHETTGDDAFLGSSTSPSKAKIRVQKTMVVVVTAYSSTPDQTDSTPNIMANGKHVYDGAIAANFLPFGTKVKFPKLFGDKIFVVEDRMHERFSDRADIWMETRQAAINFGLRRVLIEIVG